MPDIVVNTTITGPAGRGIIVQGTTNQNSPYSVFKVAQGATVEIDNLQITDGYAAQLGGGGVQNLGNLTLKNDVIRNNFAIGAAQSGGDIYNGGGASLTLDDDLIWGNEALAGGGIANYGTISGVGDKIDSNQASAPVGGDGGGIFNGTDPNAIRLSRISLRG